MKLINKIKFWKIKDIIKIEHIFFSLFLLFLILFSLQHISLNPNLFIALFFTSVLASIVSLIILAIPIEITRHFIKKNIIKEI